MEKSFGSYAYLKHHVPCIQVTKNGIVICFMKELLVEYIHLSFYFADDKANRTTTGLQMVLVRLLMGDIFVTATPHNYKHPPCKACKTENCVEPKHDQFDSVVADGQWLFREFLVYDSPKCYPEYIITYDRV